jgi:hypothetical protein
LLKCAQSVPVGRRPWVLRNPVGGEMELTQTQQQILAKLKELNAKQAAALAKQVTNWSEFHEIEETENEIIALHCELVESLRLTQTPG